MFTKAIVYNLEAAKETADRIENSATDHSYDAPHGIRQKSVGFSPLLDDDLFYRTNRFFAFCVTIATKDVPPAALKSKLKREVAFQEQLNMRSLSRDEKRDLKEGIIVEALPHYLPIERNIYCYIDLIGGIIVINASTENITADVFSFLRKVTGSIGVTPLEASRQNYNKLTHWCERGAIDDNEDVRIGHQFSLEGHDSEKLTSSFAPDETLTAAVDGGLYVTKMRLHFENISFDLTDDLQFKRIKYSHELGADLERGDFYGDLVLKIGELNQAIFFMIENFSGGELAA